MERYRFGGDVGFHRTFNSRWCSSREGRDSLYAMVKFCPFDNTTTREERLKEDKLATIRDLWTTFLVRLQICYTPGGSPIVNEQLVSTRGRCNFRQYIPSKPGKYGLKIFWCCDSDTAYPLNGEVYLGHQPGAPSETKDENRICLVFKQLSLELFDEIRRRFHENYSLMLIVLNYRRYFVLIDSQRYLAMYRKKDML